MLRPIVLLVCAQFAYSGLVPRILNGEDASIEDYPYQISLEVNGRHQCGGSIISPTRILTAAHCTYRNTVDQLTIRAGSTIRGQGGQVRSVSQNFVHPNWNNPPSFNNDVAVLVLSEAFELNDKVQTVELATIDGVPVGAYATVTGWGITENNTFADTLQKLDYARFSQAACKKIFSSLFNSDTMTCYKHPHNHSFCASDSGGPLVYNGVQVGIVAFNSEPCGKPIPDVYTRVDAFLDFINSH